MKTISWLAVVSVVIATADAARQGPAPQPDAAATLISEFRADDWTRRAAAFEQLKRQPQILTLSRKKKILTEVVERENHQIDDAFREGTGASDKYGESYSEYAATLAPYLLSIVDVQDVDAVVAVAQSAYTDNSILTRQLATYGEVLVPTVLHLAASDISPQRWQAFGLAGEIYNMERHRATKAPISVSSSSQLKEVLVAGARDADLVNRRIAVYSMGIAGLPEFLPQLELIAQTDVGVTTFRGYAERPVRDEARKAIARIRSGR